MFNQYLMVKQKALHLSVKAICIDCEHLSKVSYNPFD